MQIRRTRDGVPYTGYDSDGDGILDAHRVDAVPDGLLMRALERIQRSPSARQPSPYPPRIQVTHEPAHLNSKMPQWVDNDGVWWAITHNPEYGLHKSDDFGETWVKVLDPPYAVPQSGVTNTQALIISDTGRAIVSLLNGEVWVTDEAKTRWTLAFKFPAGYSAQKYAHDKYKNIILLGSYGDLGTYSMDNPPRWVYASFDDGESWSMIFEDEVVDGPSNQNQHVHACVYDPWADRIWVAVGDSSKRNLFYSDDRGETWVAVHKRGQGKQVTSIIPGPYSVMFGSDQGPDGIGIWLRPKNSPQPVVHAEDIDYNYYILDPTAGTTMNHVFSRGWKMIEDPQNPLFVLACGRSGIGTRQYARIIISQDGLHFHEIWRGPKDSDISYITGPWHGDPERRFMGRASIGGVVGCIKGRIPRFSSEVL